MPASDPRISVMKKICGLPSGSFKLAFFLLPPLHILYLFSILQVVRQEKEDNKRILLYVMSIGAVAFILGSFFLINLPGVFDAPALKGQVLVFVFGLLVLYLMFLIHLSIVTVDFDRKRKSQHYFEFTDMDYVLRFTALLLLPVSIWYLHAKVKPFDAVPVIN